MMHGMLQRGSRPKPVVLHRGLPRVSAIHRRIDVRLFLAIVGLMLAMILPARPALADNLAFHPVEACAPATPSAQCPPARPGNWTWFSVEPAGIAAMPANWNLLVDLTRFSAIDVRVLHNGGVYEVRRGQFELSGNWSLGNNLRFVIPVAGHDVQAVQIGFRNMDSAHLMRRVRALDENGHNLHALRWTVQVTLVMGVLFAAFCYNIFLLSWLRTPFQRWYVVWLASGLAYLLVWTGVALNFVPFLAGPASVRTSYLLLGLLVVSGAAFFFALLEKDTVDQKLLEVGQVAGMMVAFTAVVAAFDMVFPADLGDRMLNLAIMIVTFTMVIAAVQAMQRNSRAIWFYIAGWGPALVILGLRITRNFGLMDQNDTIDSASFGAIGWESLLFSVAIADRFRQLRRDADAADAERDALMRVATTDPLTGLGNRALFQSLIDQPQRRDAGIDMIAVDIDFLKQTNDMAGHDAGDALIVAVAERLAAAAGPNATIARVGGDEFIILLEGPARNRLPAVRQMIALSSGVPLRHAGHNLTISMCAGHAAAAEGATLAQVFKQADLALYRAKAAGRGCWRSYDSGMADDADARSRLLGEARTGLSNGEFLVHYLPIQRLDGHVVGHEALLRWQHPRLGLLSPGDFAEVMRDAALLPSLQGLVLERALAEAARLRADNPRLVMSVNFVTGQLQGTAAAVAILDELSRHRLPPDALVVEVTEAVVMGGLGGALVECLECLRDAGVNVALDDFGTGHASLVQLRDVPCNIVKIDRGFVARMAESPGSQHVVRAIVDLAHSLGKQVVAEGVETELQRGLLGQMGCDLAQGWLFGQPLEPALSRAA